jgi:multiple sugar transport system substrate-binding protein
MANRQDRCLNRRQVIRKSAEATLGLGLGGGSFSSLSSAAFATSVSTLTVAAFPAVDQIVTAAIPEWQRRAPNTSVKVVSRQFQDHHTAMTTALSTSAYLPDIIALEVGYVGRFAQGGGLENLNAEPYQIGGLKDRVVAYALDQAKGRGGSIVAMPTDLGPGTLLYREDILRRAGLSEENLTRSWDGYVESGIKVKAATGAYLLAHARDMKDIIIRTGIAPGQGIYFDSQSKVLVNSERFERAFVLARKIRQHKLDAKVSAWSNEWTEGFKRGSLATQLSGAWLAGHLNNWLAPKTSGLWRAAQLPEGAWAAYGGTFFAIPKNAKAENKPLAWALIKMLTVERQMQLNAFKSQDAFPALVSAHNDAFFEQPLEFLGGQKARLLWREAAQRISAVQVHKQDSFADEVVNTELDKVLDRGKEIRLALADAQRLLEKRAHR